MSLTAEPFVVYLGYFQYINGEFIYISVPTIEIAKYHYKVIQYYEA